MPLLIDLIAADCKCELRRSLVYFLIAMKVLITGASGLLGRALVKRFRASSWEVTGVSNKRTGDGLVQVNLMDNEAMNELIINSKPNVIIHAAAERDCNKVDTDYDSAWHLNVKVTEEIANLSVKVNAFLIYISTDYVFDGTQSPYKETDATNPLNKYGITKLEGEKAALKANEDACILRVPLLYGPVEYLNESVVTGLFSSLLKSSETILISDYEIRFPTHVNDVAETCYRLTNASLQNLLVKGIYHCSSKEAMTKYVMIKSIAKIHNISMDHIVPDPHPTKGAPRPYNSQLDTAKLESIVGELYTPFSDGISKCLKHFLP